MWRPSLRGELDRLAPGSSLIARGGLPGRAGCEHGAERVDQPDDHRRAARLRGDRRDEHAGHGRPRPVDGSSRSCGWPGTTRTAGAADGAAGAGVPARAGARAGRRRIAAATLVPMVKGITGSATPYIPPAGWVAVIGGMIVLGSGGDGRPGAARAADAAGRRDRSPQIATRAAVPPGRSPDGTAGTR